MAIVKRAWPGRSGERYEFEEHQLPQAFDRVKGNYIFARLDQNDVWHAIYIGEGWLDERASPQNEHWDCIQEKGATTVFVRAESNDATRLDVESDLLDLHREAYAPTGCNQER